MSVRVCPFYNRWLSTLQKRHRITRQGYYQASFVGRQHPADGALGLSGAQPQGNWVARSPGEPAGSSLPGDGGGEQ